MHSLRLSAIWPTRSVLLLAAAGAACLIPPAVAWAEAAGRMTPIVAAVREAAPAVVNIQGQKSVLDPALDGRTLAVPREVNGMGTGVVIDPRGYILTNHHVVAGVRQINVTLDGGQAYVAQMVAHDDETDLAIIRIRTPQPLVTIRLGTSDDLMTGETVLALGNAFGYEHTVTSGIISALGRSDGSADSYQDFIQTDAPINPGNSGGALVDLKGQLVGVNTAIFSGSGGNIGIGFAIPSNMVKAVMTQLVQYGEVKRGMLGVQLSNQFTPEIAQSLGLDTNRGAWVSEVVEGGAADKAGIKAGDVITSINGRAVANASELRNNIGLLRIGDKVDLGLLRDGKPRRVTAVIGERSGGDADAATQIHQAFEGATLTNADGNGGVLIRTVAPGSPAAQSGFQPNDVILMIGRTPVANMDQLRAALKNVNSFAITIQRGRSRLVFPVG